VFNIHILCWEAIPNKFFELCWFKVSCYYFAVGVSGGTWSLCVLLCDVALEMEKNQCFYPTHTEEFQVRFEPIQHSGRLLYDETHEMELQVNSTSELQDISMGHLGKQSKVILCSVSVHLFRAFCYATNSMKSPWWADICSASEEIPSLLSDSDIHRVFSANVSYCEPNTSSSQPYTLSAKMNLKIFLHLLLCIQKYLSHSDIPIKTVHQECDFAVTLLII
jgi:hypothetical protein